MWDFAYLFAYEQVLRNKMRHPKQNDIESRVLLGAWRGALEHIHSSSSPVATVEEVKRFADSLWRRARIWGQGVLQTLLRDTQE